MATLSPEIIADFLKENGVDLTDVTLSADSLLVILKELMTNEDVGGEQTPPDKSSNGVAL